MKAFVFAESNARGGALIMVGDSIREAEVELENRSRWRPTMGTSATTRQVAECDSRYLTAEERLTIGGTT